MVGDIFPLGDIFAAWLWSEWLSLTEYIVVENVPFEVLVLCHVSVWPYQWQLTWNVKLATESQVNSTIVGALVPRL